MRRAVFLFLLVFLSSSLIAEEFARKYFVVWNVGQGSWATLVNASECLHFDRGGEFFPGKYRRLCAGKMQRLFVSHWDWDHVGGVSSLDPATCLAVRPLGKSSARKMKLLSRFEDCGAAGSAGVLSWSPDSDSDLARGKNSNDKSHIFLTRSILIPGDAPVASEKQWLRTLPLSSVRILVLGHHGSKTSTSGELLAAMPGLRQAVSSARWRRYRHPHPEVVARLSAARVPVLRTEDWGNIWFGM